MSALAVLMALLLYGALHSGTASAAFKARVSGLMGERAFLGLYRLSYTIVSVVTLVPVLILMGVLRKETIWNAEGTTASLLLATRALAVLGLAIALLQIDALRFLGIKDAVAYLRGRPLPLPPERLAARGVYRLVRHPLYLFGLIALWSSPVMEESALGFAVGVTIYAAVGSILEERKMTRVFGPEYEAYRKAVPWLIPFVKPGRWRHPRDHRLRRKRVSE